MAIIQNPVIGRARKQAGGMVFSKMYDKNVMRSKPAQVTPSNTTKQQGQRAFIALLTAYIKGLTPDNLISLYPNKPAQRSRYSEFQKQLAVGRDVTGASAAIDFEAITVLGNGIDVVIPDLAYEYTSSEIEVTWNGAPTPSNLNASDKCFAVIFNKTLNQAFQTVPASSFAVGSLIVTYPSGWSNSNDYEVYAGFISTKFKPGSELSSNCKRAAEV